MIQTMNDENINTQNDQEPTAAATVLGGYTAAGVLLVDHRGHFVLGQVGKNRSKGM